MTPASDGKVWVFYAFLFVLSKQAVTSSFVDCTNVTALADGARSYLALSIYFFIGTFFSFELRSSFNLCKTIKISI